MWLERRYPAGGTGDEASPILSVTRASQLRANRLLHQETS